MIKYKTTTAFILVALAVMAIGLVTHSYLQSITTPVLLGMVKGHTFPSPAQYSTWIVSWAYITAFEQSLVITTVYYFAANLIKTNKLTKILLLSFILLELHGNLIRMTAMTTIVASSAGIPNPFLYGLLSQVNQIASNVLLVIALVIFCPTKQYR